MQLLFIDESGTPLPKDKNHNSPYFVLGGVVIPESIWHPLNNDFNAIKKNYKVIGEIKWRFFAPQKSETKSNLSHLTLPEKEQLREEIYKLINQYSLKIHCFACNIEKIYENFINATEGDHIYSTVYMQLVESFDDYLKAFDEKTNGLVICDNREPPNDKKLREAHALMIEAWKVIGSSSSLIEGLLIAPSHLSLGIQIADMVNGAVYRKISKGDERFYKQIEKLFVLEANEERKQFKHKTGINLL